MARLLALLWGGSFALLAMGAEVDYQLPLCEAAGGVAEYLLSDRTRVDCLTATHAVEFDFAPKWAEAIGQALYYASRTNRRAAVALIMRSPKDERYLRRIEAAVMSAGVELDVWPIFDVTQLSRRVTIISEEGQ